MGGRRRRGMRGGMGYGFGGAMGTNGAVWDAAWGGEVTKAGEPVTGGRRRQGSRKSRKGGKKRRRSTRRGGADEDDMPAAFPSDTTSEGDMPSAFSSGPSAPMSSPGMSSTGPVMMGPAAALSTVPEATPSQEEDVGSGRRKSRKSSKKSRGGRKGGKKSRKVRKMRGGGSVGLVGASFTGQGVRGMADYSAYPSNLPPSGGFAIPTGTR